MRTAHANPTLGIKCTAMSGKMTPPSEEPAMANPPAKARLFLKYVMGWIKVSWISRNRGMGVTYSSHTRRKDKRRPNSRTDRLAQGELVVFFRQTSHHEAQDVQDRADEDGRAGAVVVEHPAC